MRYSGNMSSSSSSFSPAPTKPPLMMKTTTEEASYFYNGGQEIDDYDQILVTPIRPVATPAPPPPAPGGGLTPYLIMTTPTWPRIRQTKSTTVISTTTTTTTTTLPPSECVQYIRMVQYSFPFKGVNCLYFVVFLSRDVFLFPKIIFG